MDIFDNINPLDYRYIGRKENLRKKVSEFLSENARIKYNLKVEAVLAKALAKEKICSEKIAEEIVSATEKVSAVEVYEEEDKIHHDIRAITNCIKSKVSNEARPFVHLGATSYDIVDTSAALRYKHATEKLILPELLKLEKTLIDLSLREKNTLQVGRTHGQHAVPITFGFSIASYVSRLGSRIQAVKIAKDNLCGKFSGAVGAYNATSLFIKVPVRFEKEIMSELGLKASVSSTQIVEPESLADLLHAMLSAFSILANIADDMRNLQRSEINEIGEEFHEKQVGSSTMPHKRNPINFENVKSFWKHFMPYSIQFYLDHISEHQRDLTNSASQRFISEFIAGFYVSILKLENTLSKLYVDKEKMKKNFEMSKEMVVAEPLYILLALYKHPDAHEEVRKLTLDAEKSGKPLQEVALQAPEMKSYLEKFTAEQKALIENPEKYTGLSSKKTEEICNYWKKELEIK